jgi:hypothetical protein
MDTSNNNTKQTIPPPRTVGCIHPLNDPNSTLHKSLDEKNRIAMKIMKEKGPDAAAKHMMEMAGGDYLTMRMIYG